VRYPCVPPERPCAGAFKGASAAARLPGVAALLVLFERPPLHSLYHLWRDAILVHGEELETFVPLRMDERV